MHTLVWDEEYSGTAKTMVEPHEQTKIEVRVAEIPYSAAAYENYADSRRSRHLDKHRVQGLRTLARP